MQSNHGRKKALTATCNSKMKLTLSQEAVAFQSDTVASTSQTTSKLKIVTLSRSSPKVKLLPKTTPTMDLSPKKTRKV